MLSPEFLALSRRIGTDPLLVQGPGGNTSVKADGRMWIKASGTVLADADAADIFVEVDVASALAELDGAGDGSCRAALVDPAAGLRPSIETTFHAMFPQKYVFHFHSVNTICHAISHEGRHLLTEKLQGLTWVAVPYRQPGIPLSRAIRESVQKATRESADARHGDADIEVIVLENHGIIVLGDDLSRVEQLIDDVEQRLSLPVVHAAEPVGEVGRAESPAGWQRVESVRSLAGHPLVRARAMDGTYYPDHVVFLGPGLPLISGDRFAQAGDSEFEFPAVIVQGSGVFLRESASAAHRAMLQCVHDVLVRVPADWSLIPIGPAAEAALLNWDAEKYRQQLARRAASATSAASDASAAESAFDQADDSPSA